jgi:hypothetical protein
MNVAEMVDEVRRLSDLLDNGITALRQKGHAAAEAERDYRKAKAQAWVTAADGTGPERQAAVDGQCADLRYARDLAENQAKAALEAVRARRQQLSALQSIAAAQREEAGFAKYGQEVGP